MNLTREIEALQEEFKVSHKYLDGMKQTGPNSHAVKREIQQMEEEKQQLISKITKIQKKVNSIPKAEQWLQAAQNLRAEQQKEIELADRLRDQRLQIQQVERKYASVQQTLKNIQVNCIYLHRTIP